MLWYLLKTWVGGEERLASEIRRTVPPHLYGECFVIYQERIWRRQQRSIMHVEALFPGCVFITCKKTAPLFQRLGLVPSMSGLLARGEMTMLPLAKEDADFLAAISGEEHIVRLSYVWKDEEGRISGISEPLSVCRGQVERYQFKKRYATVRHSLWGEDMTLALGIALKEDVEQKLLYEDMKISLEMFG